jgi:tRNA(Ile)-lysidine synthase
MSPDQLIHSVAARIAPLVPAGGRVLLGLSGGVDSVVLLHILRQLASHHGWQLAALHVHHGISTHADAWSAFCIELCARHRVPLTVERVDVAPLRGQHGMEAAARKLRYAAFARQACDVVALAHHADDQAETLLLQLLRGTGVRGASAMPSLSRHLDKASVLRPLLPCTRQQILDYAVAQQLQWVEDESNADVHYARNFLRHQVLPVLAQKFPDYRAVLTRDAQHFAEAGALLDDLARIDAASAMDYETLAVVALQTLSQARARNLLRYFLHWRGVPMPQTVQLDVMLRQLCEAQPDAQVCVICGDWQVRRYQGKVYVLQSPGEFDAQQVMAWHEEAELVWPALHARLIFIRGAGCGVSLKKLQQAPVTLRFRSGGEKLRPHLHAATRTLKNLLQEHYIPPWQRERLPLLYCGAKLVCVPGVAVAAEYQAAPDEQGVQVALCSN